ncbi:MAG: hypothetical protein AAGC45_01995 [Bacteroidota bacterium]
MNKWIFFAGFLLIMQACAQQPYFGKLDHLGRFPLQLSEVSGIDTDKTGKLWAIEDNGNKDVLYQLDFNANPVKKLKIENAKNGDWEDLTISQDGTIYIGDFGNNDNRRKDLVIYRIPQKQLDKKTPKAEKIEFYYPQQKDFPPKKNDFLFDSEGFFYWNGYFYIFTKNRSKPYSGKTLAYRVPDKKGTHKAEFLGEFTLCTDQKHCSVTGADISANGKTIALIGYGFIYLLTEFDFNDFSSPKISAIDLQYSTQIESVCFLDENTLLIADEQSKTKGRNLYKYDLKSKP